eukprot:1189126-Prorocentrum_minimum.AAC.1
MYRIRPRTASRSAGFCPASDHLRAKLMDAFSICRRRACSRSWSNCNRCCTVTCSSVAWALPSSANAPRLYSRLAPSSARFTPSSPHSARAASTSSAFVAGMFNPLSPCTRQWRRRKLCLRVSSCAQLCDSTNSARNGPPKCV